MTAEKCVHEHYAYKTEYYIKDKKNRIVQVQLVPHSFTVRQSKMTDMLNLNNTVSIVSQKSLQIT